MPYAVLACRWTLAVTLAAAAVAKFGLRDEVREAVGRYQVLPDDLVAPVARILPTLELALAVWLASGAVSKGGGMAACVLFATFGAVITWNLAKGQVFDCGCGISSDREISWSLVVRDLLFAALALLVVVEPVPALSIFPGSRLVETPGVTQLLPVPLAVLLAAVTARLAATTQDIGAAWPPSLGRLGRSSADASESPTLTIIHTNASAEG